MQPYTSGSTGKPKGVLLAHRGQVWNADIIRKMACLDDTERALVAVPLYHKNAMIGAVKPFLLAGGSLVILPGFDPIEVIRAIDRHQVTYLTGVPAMYKMMLAEKDTLARHSVRSIRYALCGSAEVPEELLVEFQRVFGAPIGESYGLTEGGPVPMANPRYGLKKLGSCGVDVADCQNRIVSTADGVTDCAVDEVGELVTRNPGLAKGFWKLPEVTAQKIRDGWLFTGDLMRRDGDGYYYFVGRKDDMINVAGENLYPKEVEDVLLRHPGLKDACVVPAPTRPRARCPSPTSSPATRERRPTRRRSSASSSSAARRTPIRAGCSSWTGSPSAGPASSTAPRSSARPPPCRRSSPSDEARAVPAAPHGSCRDCAPPRGASEAVDDRAPPGRQVALSPPARASSWSGPRTAPWRCACPGGTSWAAPTTPTGTTAA